MRPVYLPRNLEELWEILSDNPGARLYAGGTDLLVRLRKGLMAPSSLVCLERISVLKGVHDHGESLFIGACTTHHQLLNDPLIQAHFPILAKALKVLGSPPIRHMGTIGGNLVTASPAGDTLPPLCALGAEVELRSRDASRRVGIRDFIKGPGHTDLSPVEILAGAWLKKDPCYAIHHFEKIGQRKALSIAVVSMAALLQVSGSGAIERVRLAWGSVGPTVVTSDAVESALVGKPLDRRTLLEAVPLAQEAVSPIDDVRASASYRKAVSGNLLLRLLVYANKAPEPAVERKPER